MTIAKPLALPALVVITCLASLTACTPLDTTGPDNDSIVVAGTYILDGTAAYGHASHEEWLLSPSGTLTIRHFSWNEGKESGCFDSRSTGNSWSAVQGRITVVYSGTRSYRSACDSAWRDTTNSKSGTVSYLSRNDSLGFDFLDSATGTWHSMLKL